MLNATIPELVFHLEMTRFIAGFKKLSSYPTKCYRNFSSKFRICIDYLPLKNNEHLTT